MHLTLTLHFPPVACFIAHFLHRLGCLHPGAWYAIGSVEQLRHTGASELEDTSPAELGSCVVEADLGGSEKPRVMSEGVVTVERM